MKEIPILYSTPMILAKLAGRKTITRRPVKQAVKIPKEWMVVPIKEEHNDGRQRYELRCGTKYSLHYFKCPYGQPGDILYAKEGWCLMNLEENPAHPPKFYYKADGEDIRVVDGDGYQVYNKNGTAKSPWKSSRFMPKVASRIWERVISVLPERLGDITEEDAVREGILKIDFGLQTPAGSASIDGGKTFHPFKPQRVYGYSFDPDAKQENTLQTARSAFINLWLSIHGPESWNPDLWVWRIETEVLSTTGRPANL